MTSIPEINEQGQKESVKVRVAKFCNDTYKMTITDAGTVANLSTTEKKSITSKCGKFSLKILISKF